MSGRYQYKPRKVCADCGHHKSAHQYHPEEDGRQPPGKCRLCSCKRYRQPARGERITRRPVELGVQPPVEATESPGVCPSCGGDTTVTDNQETCGDCGYTCQR